MSVAIVGSGISGLATAWLLSRQGHDVTIYEADETCGGHTLTDDTADGPPVDLGFQVFNLTTYPHFTEFLEALGVESEPSDMSFSLSVDGGKLEWASHGADTIFAQRCNACNPRFLRMIADVLRFTKMAKAVLAEEQYEEMTLGEFVKLKGLSHQFVHWYLLPMAAAVWSCSNADVMNFSVRSLVRFWTNHHLIDALGVRPKWRVVKARSQAYVAAVLKALDEAGGTVRTSTPVASLRRTRRGVDVIAADGDSQHFDRVVLACHSDQALRILGSDASQEEMDVLGAIKYQANDVWLHSDPAMMPISKRAWASWNVLDRTEANADASAPNAAPVTVTYWLNHLQNLPEGTPLRLCTLNPASPPAPEHRIRQLTLAHPVLNAEAVAAQRKVPSIQGSRGVWFAGAWTGYGFHEDGMRSAIAVADSILGKSSVPWIPRPLSPNVTYMQSIFAAGFDRLARAGIKKGELRLVLPNGDEKVYGDRTLDLAPGVPPQCARVRVTDMNFFQRVAKDSDIGLGEAFMYHEIECADLAAFLAVAAANSPELSRLASKLGPLNWIGSQIQYLAHLARSNTIAGSRKNINEHYDIGNDLFALFLDDTMTYSSAIFPGYTGGRGPEAVPGLEDVGGDDACSTDAGSELLKEATFAKLDEIIAKAQLTEADHVVEIGCGWGSFAIRAAQKTGCRVTGITISTEQLDIAKSRVEEAGLSDLVNLVLCDYRKLKGDAELMHKGGFDKLVSIEMLEAVGHENLQEYFDVCSQLVRPGGLCVIQVITIPDERYEMYCNSSDFIKRHIFPGGHLPAKSSVEAFISGLPLSLVHVHDIGPHYAPTLRMWRLRFKANREKILALGYSDVFYRKWVFYFAYCEAAFANRYLFNYHYTFERTETAMDSDEVPVGQHLAPGVIVESASAVAARVSFSPSSTAAATSGTFTLVAQVSVAAASCVCVMRTEMRGVPIAVGSFLLLKLLIYHLFARGFTHERRRLAFRNACCELIFTLGCACGLFAWLATVMKGDASISELLVQSSAEAVVLVMAALGYVANELIDGSVGESKRRDRNVMVSLFLGSSLLCSEVPTNLAAVSLISVVNDVFISARTVLQMKDDGAVARTVATNKRGEYTNSDSYSCQWMNWVLILLSFIGARVVPDAALLWWSVQYGLQLLPDYQFAVFCSLAVLGLNAYNASVGVSLIVKLFKDARERGSRVNKAL